MRLNDKTIAGQMRKPVSQEALPREHREAVSGPIDSKNRYFLYFPQKFLVSFSTSFLPFIITPPSDAFGASSPRGEPDRSAAMRLMVSLHGVRGH